MIFLIIKYFKAIPKKIQDLLYEGLLLNWSALNKSILVLIIAGIDQFLWLIWCIYAYVTPSVGQWFDLAYLYQHMLTLMMTVISFFILAKLADRYKHLYWMQQYFPYFAILYFSFVFLHGGYSIGIMSPATIAGYVSLATVGLVLFERKIIYLTFIPVSIVLLVLILFSVHGYIDYAPTFNSALNQSVLMENKVWVYSMLYLYIPIFFAAIVLFEILLLQWRHREKTFDMMSRIDPLTGIFNRRMIGEHLQALQHDRQKYAIILLDLDYFKNINDVYGHAVGDLVLQRVAKILSENVREDDVVGRFGGEEFILILKEKQQQYAMEIAERCRQKIADERIYLEKSHETLSVSASFGMSLSDVDLSEEIIVRQADEALYHAKASGRNQVKCYHQSNTA